MGRRAPILLFVLSSCAAPDPSGVRIIGHGGMGDAAEFPMNSAEAILGGLGLGIDGVELDVQLTADSVLIAYHNEDLRDLTDCEGKINGHRWEELAPCANTTAAIHHPLVRLDSLLPDLAARFPNTDFTLDIKLFAEGDWWSYLHAFRDALITLEAQPSLKGRLILECQEQAFIHLMHEAGPDIPLFLYAKDLPADIDRAVELACSGITANNSKISEGDIEQAHKAGLQVTIFGVGGAWGHGDALRKKPDRLQTDAPKELVRQRSEPTD